MAEEQKAGWMQLSDALLLQSESSSLTDTDGGTDWLCAHEQHSIVVFNCGSTWNSLLKVSTLLFASELIRHKKKNKKNQALQGAKAPQPLIFLRWADTFFNYAHEGRELEA